MNCEIFPLDCFIVYGKPFLSLKQLFNSKQLYINNKTECFSYKYGCGVMCIKAFTRRVNLVIDKQLQVISNKMLFTMVIPLRN